MKPTPAALGRASELLAQVMQFSAPADAQLSAYFRRHPALGRAERAWMADGVYAVLRHFYTLTRLLGSEAPPRLLLAAAWLKFGGVSLRELEPALTREEAAALGGLKGAGPEGLPLSAAAELPDWVIDALRPTLNDAAILALGRALQNPAPLDARVNTLKAKREDVLARLAGEGVAAQATPYSPWGVRLPHGFPLQRHPLFLDGSMEVQDEGSQLIALLLAPRRGEKVVDLCAGAGGKTLALGAQMAGSGRIYALDTNAQRLAKLGPRLARAGLANVTPQIVAPENDQRLKRLAGKIDRVLVDAPCSGLGTLRRNPDLKFRQSPASVAELNRKQAALIRSAARLLRPGGRLVYATCSLLPAENRAIVDAFLAEHPEFKRIPAANLLPDPALDEGGDMLLSPARHGSDGFYAAVLQAP